MRILIVASLILAIAAACDGRAGYAAPAQFCAGAGYGQRQCDAIVHRAIEANGIDPSSVVGVELGLPDGLQAGIGGWLVATARLTMADGSVVEQEVHCIGVGTESNAWCVEDPQIVLWMGANHDVPCAGEPPAGCATPIVLDPATVATARALTVDALDIPATPGHHEIGLGTALLPGGYLSESTFALADPAPAGVVVPDGIRLEIRPTDPTRPPFQNVYDRGVIDGLEEVEAWLVFDVDAAPDGAIIQVRDVNVR